MIENAITCGLIPDYGDMPAGAIIGYADVTGFTEEKTSLWAQGHPCQRWKWLLRDAHLFKNPIPCRGRTGLFDVPDIDANNLPESFFIPRPERHGTELFIPLGPEVFDSIGDRTRFTLYLTEQNECLFDGYAPESLPLEKVIFRDWRTGRSAGFQVQGIDIVEEKDTAGRPVRYFDSHGDEEFLEVVSISYSKFTLWTTASPSSPKEPGE